MKGASLSAKSVINRKNVKPNRKDNVNAANDFLTIITTCHILAATMKVMEMEELIESNAC